jgi:hypothetical protein
MSSTSSGISIYLGLAALIILLFWSFENRSYQFISRYNPYTYKILISVAAHSSPGRPLSLNYLFRLLHEYEENFSSIYNVHICVDTNSKELAETLNAHKPTRSTREVRVWSLEDLGGDPEYLPHMHRHYWEEKEDDFDFFIFTEDDILFTLESFEMYVKRRQVLQEKGWSFGWVRVETWGVDNTTLVALDILESRPIMKIFETPDGYLWAEPFSPYTAHYVLDRYELRSMIEDPSNIWTKGFPAIDTREEIAMGYNYKFSGNINSNPYGARGWQSRSLIPISRNCTVEQPGGIVTHLPSKYAKTTSLITNNDCIEGGPSKWGSWSNWGLGSNRNCAWGRLPLSRVFLCSDEVSSVSLPLWSEGAKLN